MYIVTLLVFLAIKCQAEVTYRDYSSYNEYDSSFTDEDFELFHDCKGKLVYSVNFTG